jgi:hypothetical protein
LELAFYFNNLTISKRGGLQGCMAFRERDPLPFAAKNNVRKRNRPLLFPLETGDDLAHHKESLPPI